jgi:PPOX class probable F420-dependent enzyme
MVPDGLTDLLEGAAVRARGDDRAGRRTAGHPVWFAWDGRHILFSQVPERQKVKSLRRDPRIALSIMDFDNPQRYLEIRGVVVAIDDDDHYAFVASPAKRYLRVEKYRTSRESSA